MTAQEIAPRDVPIAPPDTRVVRVESLTKRYGAITALDDLTLELAPGIIGLVGANGAGKSTLIKILLGLLAPTSGRVSVLGMDPSTDGTALRQFVGYMPEHNALPPDISATELVAHLAQLSGLPRSAARERTSDVLRHVGLYEERYRPIGGYSTGMRQRAQLAQALVHDPRLLLLDEPTNGLDPAGRDEMLELIRRTGREFGITIVLASHLLGEIEELCDFLVAIDGGRLLRAAPLAEFTTETGVLRVEVEHGRDDLAAALRTRGLRVLDNVNGDVRSIQIALDELEPYDAIRDAVADLGLPLIRIERRRHSLEDLFR
ncbi:MAG: type transport system ATP-binding protein [Chloroflexota bacterium]|nr:type transport system ATP-binding protein [Chloroflexota bacterium]